MTWPDDYINKIICGEASYEMSKMPDESIQCCITSPPYWGLRDYQTSGQLGLETTPEKYVEQMVNVFEEVRRILRPDGTLWLNLGDSYWGGKGKSSQAWSTENQNRKTLQKSQHHISGHGETRPSDGKHKTIKRKDLVGIPWMLAFALRTAGWYLRCDIIWSKPNPMPESVTDRPTKAHEYLFLLTKSDCYYYDNDAIREPHSQSSIDRLSQNIEGQAGSGRANGGNKTNGPMKAVMKGGISKTGYDKEKWIDRHDGISRPPMTMKDRIYNSDGRNKRSVWEVATMPFKQAHFATFPIKLIEPCILAGSKPGDIILDPFSGAGTTAFRSKELARKYIGVELNPDYCKIAEQRLAQGELF